MFKKAKKMIKKDLQKRYEKMEDLFQKFEHRVYGHLEDRLETLESRIDELSDLLNRRLDQLAEQQGAAPKEEAAQEETNPSPEEEAPAQDDLCQIKGIGKVMAEQLAAAGIHRFEQLAELGPEEIKALDLEISGFQNRLERYNWQEQAQQFIAES
ncbi:helix-hairpin-helix domain-containing protein [Saprospira grandis]|uniref:Ribosomal protein L21 n=1 Tax=Saprospira grandis (strain Lewin) TaxID=984262 RepID=H6L6P4_SAPGL|nr:helix-hairpin-helix domain-containing protein [Saprospira grandis]AFC25290.1 ribosomal protein L21 [Saprospira grandis str. Lewin]